MKSYRILLAVVALALTVTACDTDPVGPNSPPPVIGSGTGT